MKRIILLSLATLILFSQVSYSLQKMTIEEMILSYYEKGEKALAKKKYMLAFHTFNLSIGLFLRNAKRINLKEVGELVPRMYFGRLHASLVLGYLQESLRDCNVLRRIAPDQHKILLLRGDILNKMKNFQAAVKDYEKYLKLKGADIHALVNGANSYVRLKNYDKAVSYYLKALKIKPKYAGVYYNLAAVYSLKKNQEKSCLYLQKLNQVGFKKWTTLKSDDDFKFMKKSTCLKRYSEDSKKLSN